LSSDIEEGAVMREIKVRWISKKWNQTEIDLAGFIFYRKAWLEFGRRIDFTS